MIEFEKKISYGHIATAVFQAGVVLTALGAGWLTGRDQIHDLQGQLAYALQNIATLQARQDTYQANVTGTLDRVQNILTDLRLETASKTGGGVRR